MAPAIQGSTRADSQPYTWLVAGGVWLLAGFTFPFLGPATDSLSEGLQGSLSSAAGMSGELAYRVAFTVFRIPLTAALALLAAGAQLAFVRDVRSLARQWLIAAAVWACISTLIWLPSSLVVLQIAGSDETVLRFLTVSGAVLLSCLVSFSQRRVARREVFVPGWFVAASVLAATLGVVTELAFF